MWFPLSDLYTKYTWKIENHTRLGNPQNLDLVIYSDKIMLFRARQYLFIAKYINTEVNFSQPCKCGDVIAGNSIGLAIPATDKQDQEHIMRTSGERE